jgi:hypothetical protein
LPIAKGGTGKSTALVKADVGLSNVDNTADLAKTVNGASKLQSTSHHLVFWLTNFWTGARWRLTSNHSDTVSVYHADYADIAHHVFGVGNYVDVKASRVLGVTYTNNTDRARFVAVGMETANDVYDYLEVKVDGVAFSAGSYAANAAMAPAVQFVVPLGRTYKVTCGTRIIKSWVELG